MIMKTNACCSNIKFTGRLQGNVLQLLETTLGILLLLCLFAMGYLYA